MKKNTKATIETRTLWTVHYEHYQAAHFHCYFLVFSCVVLVFAKKDAIKHKELFKVIYFIILISVFCYKYVKNTECYIF